MVSQILVGIIGIVVGIVLVIYSRKLVEWFGTMATAERYLGYGGTYTALRIIGIFLVIIFLLYMTGFLSTALRGIGKAIFGG
jgi:hypothetical protein